jgi:hypothetical protein
MLYLIDRAFRFFRRRDPQVSLRGDHGDGWLLRQRDRRALVTLQQVGQFSVNRDRPGSSKFSLTESAAKNRDCSNSNFLRCFYIIGRIAYV